jgi:hypothetical protein
MIVPQVVYVNYSMTTSVKDIVKPHKINIKSEIFSEKSSCLASRSLHTTF